MLGLETEREAVPVALAILALHASVQEISRVELQTRLGGRYLQHSPGLRIVSFRRYKQCARRFLVQHPIVIVAFAKLQLRVVLIDPRANGSRMQEIERRVAHLAKLAGRNQRGIDRSNPAGMDRELMLEHVAISLPSQIEIGMMR